MNAMCDLINTTDIGIDILFITHLEIPRDTGDPEVYKPLRLHIGKNEATFQFLEYFVKKKEINFSDKKTCYEENKIFLPPVLTPIYLSDYVTKRGLNFFEIPCLEIYKEQVKKILKKRINIIAISTTWLPGFYGARIVRRAVNLLRSYVSHVPIIIGGVLVLKSIKIRALILNKEINYLRTRELAEHYFLIDSNLDKKINAFIMSGGGEKTLVEIAKRVKNGIDYRNLPNLAIPTYKGYHFTDIEPENIDLNNEIVDWRRHKNKIQYAEAPIRTGVGCPFNCSFCDFAGLYKTNIRSMESLLIELKTLIKAMPEPRNVYFTDDNLAVTKRRLKEFTKSLIKAKLGIKWRAFCRVDAIDSEVAELMRVSGCIGCSLGIESGDALILKNMNKKVDIEYALKVIEILDNVGINTLSTYIVGFPGETTSSIERTAQFISSIPSGKYAHATHLYYLFRFEVTPLSPVSRKAERIKYNLKGIGEKWSHNTMNSEEAKEAICKIFLKVNGPSHLYFESLPKEWTKNKINNFLEMRDSLQKKYLHDNKPIDIACLIDNISKNK
ncbi:MAG: radical SAM protein [Spirochaetales bacterium]|nr:radical SAM protein [Spirochaetales bacterium]